MAPPFLEDVILQLSEADNWTIERAIPALGLLNTVQTRKRLAELAEQSYQLALGALAQTRDPSALALLMRIGSREDHPARSMATHNTGVYGDAAIPFLEAVLKNPDADPHIDASATASPKAVPLLIDLLRNSEGLLLLDVRRSLAQLTHFVVDGSPVDMKPRPYEYDSWLKWWASNQETGEIFNTDQCVEASPLPFDAAK